MMANISLAFIAGLLFSVGLAVAGMTIPANIIGFLDVYGTWRPALMLVMVGAILVYAFATKIIMARDGRCSMANFICRIRKKSTRRLSGAPHCSVSAGASVVFALDLPSPRLAPVH